ncbi:hypothetical protein AB0M43_14490 [Longispora sp. NPDC051575]|uniref:hypothetical protein n=1 Tax=Longispora sp. NPDC051575 TaxID=3154943 RepID=UPI00341C25A7
MRQLTKPPPRPTGHPAHEVADTPQAGERREAIWCRDIAALVAILTASTPSGLFWQYFAHPSLVDYPTAYFGFHVRSHDVVITAVDDIPRRLPAFAATVDDQPAFAAVASAHHPVAVLAYAVARAVRSTSHGPTGEVTT